MNHEELWREMFENLKVPGRLPFETMRDHFIFHGKMYAFHRGIPHSRPADYFVNHELHHESRSNLVSYVESVWNEGTALTGEDLLQFHITKRQEYYFIARRLSDYFADLEQVQAFDHIRLGTELYKLALEVWKTNLMETMTEKLINTVLDAISFERTGGVINKNDITLTIKFVFDLEDDETDEEKLQLYKELFEERMLRATEEFYTKESLNFSNSNRNLVDYMLKVERILREEDENAELYYHSSTKSLLKTILEDILIVHHLPFFYSRFAELLVSENIEDLNAIYRLCRKIPVGLERLGKDLHEHFTREGFKGLETMAAETRIEPKLYVETISDLHQRFRKLVFDTFSDETEFKKSIDKACTLFINSNAITQRDPLPLPIRVTGTVAELLARYCDQMLDKKSEESRDRKLKDFSKQVMIVMKYLRNKDVFAKFFSFMLCKRIIYGSVCHEAATALMTKLKSESGWHSVLNLRKMMSDASVSKEWTREFDSKGPIEFDALVMSLPAWPMLPTAELDVPINWSNPTEASRRFYDASWSKFSIYMLNLPQQLSNTMDSFHQFYKEKYNNQRSLSWVLSQCHAEVTSDAFQTEHLFVVTAAQMCTLLLFNDQDSYTVNQICDATGMDAMTTSQVVGSLIEQQVLNAENDSTGEGISMSAIISLNEYFTSDDVRVDLAKLFIENEQERQFEKLQATLEENRQSLIKVHVVEIMETYKRMDESNLIQKVQFAMKEYYEPPIRTIELCIESLLEEMILSSVGEPPNSVYEYVQ